MISKRSETLSVFGAPERGEGFTVNVAMRSLGGKITGAICSIDENYFSCTRLNTALNRIIFYYRESP
jgi:hypothetical protein